MSFTFATKAAAKKAASKRMTTPGARLGPKFLTLNKYATEQLTKRVKTKDGKIVERPVVKKGQEVVLGYDANTKQIALLLNGFTEEMVTVKLQETETNKGSLFLSARGMLFKNNPSVQLAENQTHRMYDAALQDNMILLTPRAVQTTGITNTNGTAEAANNEIEEIEEDDVDEEAVSASSGEPEVNETVEEVKPAPKKAGRPKVAA